MILTCTLVVLVLLLPCLGIDSVRAVVVINNETTATSVATDLNTAESRHHHQERYNSVYEHFDKHPPEVEPITLAHWPFDTSAQSPVQEHNNDGYIDPTAVHQTTNVDQRFNVQEFLRKLPVDSEAAAPGDTFRAKLYDDQLYECVLLPKHNKYNSHSGKGHEANDQKVHQLYGIQMNQEEESESSGNKLKDFGNFQYVDDSNRPMHYSFPDDHRISRPKTTSGHKSGDTHNEIDELFAQLKQSLDKLMCYQNEECYGGTFGDDTEKLDQFIRHIRMSKKVFDLLDHNRKHWSFVAQPDESDQYYLHPRPAFTDSSSLVYSDSNVRPVAVRDNRFRKPFTNKYYTSSDRTTFSMGPGRRKLALPARLGTNAAGLANKSQVGKTGLASKLGKQLINGLFGGGTNHWTNHDSTTNGGDGRKQPSQVWPPPPPPPSPPRTTAHRSASSGTTSSLSGSPSSMGIRSPVAPLRSSWPKPVLIIKEYEEYND